MGGTVDPATGRVEWEMHVPIAEQLAHYRAHPPRALAGLRATPIDVEWPFDGHGEPVNTMFELACSCGSTELGVSCGLDEDGDARDPIELACAQCGAVHEVFDSSKHGYGGELGDTPAEPPDGDDELVSPDIAAPHEIIVRFEYASEELGNPAGDAARRGREQDLFTWFTLLARDAKTKRLGFLYDRECA